MRALGLQMRDETIWLLSMRPLRISHGPPIWERTPRVKLTHILGGSSMWILPDILKISRRLASPRRAHQARPLRLRNAEAAATPATAPTTKLQALNAGEVRRNRRATALPSTRNPSMRGLGARLIARNRPHVRHQRACCLLTTRASRSRPRSSPSPKNARGPLAPQARRIARRTTPRANEGRAAVS